MSVISMLGFVVAQAEQSTISYLQTKFFEGGLFMWPILACLVIGLGFSFAKLYTLIRASTNTKKFIVDVKNALNKGGLEEAKRLCENTRGPIASVFHAGLLRADEGIEAAEKAIMTYGAIEMGFLERGMIYISTFITLAPMLGFTGTVQGMIQSFDAIKEAAQMSPGIVAGGISVALLTTLFGLVVAMILQAFYNLFISRIDKIVADMEESSIELIDTLYDMSTEE